MSKDLYSSRRNGYSNIIIDIVIAGEKGIPWSGLWPYTFQDDISRLCLARK